MEEDDFLMSQICVCRQVPALCSCHKQSCVSVTDYLVYSIVV